MQSLFEILFEDSELLVVNKPSDLVCHPTKGDAYSSLISRVRLHLGAGCEPHLVNRLDRETSGVVVVAKNLPSATALRRLWESRQVEKEYWAIVHGAVADRHGVIDAPLGDDPESRVAIKGRVNSGGAPAQTEYWLERTFSREGLEFSFLRVVPHTGRKHQIRIHFAHLGHPIVGDKLYGPNEDHYLALVERRLSEAARRELLLPNHALHARSVRFLWQGNEVRFTAEPEPWFVAFLGGA